MHSRTRTGVILRPIALPIRLSVICRGSPAPAVVEDGEGAARGYLQAIEAMNETEPSTME